MVVWAGAGVGIGMGLVARTPLIENKNNFVTLELLELQLKDPSIVQVTLLEITKLAIHVFW